YGGAGRDRGQHGRQHAGAHPDAAGHNLSKAAGERGDDQDRQFDGQDQRQDGGAQRRYGDDLQRSGGPAQRPGDRRGHSLYRLIKAWFVVPPSGGSLRYRGMDLWAAIPPEGGTTNRRKIMPKTFLGVGWDFPVKVHAEVENTGKIRIAEYEESVRQA